MPASAAPIDDRIQTLVETDIMVGEHAVRPVRPAAMPVPVTPVVRKTIPLYLDYSARTESIRNIALQACGGKPLPKQILPFDRNDGAGFWWANCLNTFTRNVAAECDEYGFRFEVLAKNFDPKLPVRQPDGSREAIDIRTLPFVRFEDNESHCQRRHAFNLGGLGAGTPGGVEVVGPDAKHPFVVYDCSAHSGDEALAFVMKLMSASRAS